MSKILTSFEKLPAELKQIVNERFPKNVLGNHLIKISQNETESIFGVLFQHQGIEYLVKIVKVPVQTVNLDAIIDELDLK